MNETLEMIQNYAASGKYKRVPVSRELYADAFTNAYRYQVRYQLLK